MQETKERFFIFIDKLEDKLKEFAEAAYDYGYDGAEWILNNFGINPGDFQTVAMQWMSVRNSEDADTIRHYLDYRAEKKDEYAEQRYCRRRRILMPTIKSQTFPKL